MNAEELVRKLRSEPFKKAVHTLELALAQERAAGYSVAIKKIQEKLDAKTSTKI